MHSALTTAAETHTAVEYAALLCADFASFARHSFHELNPRTALSPSWHHEIIAAKLAAVYRGRIRRLIIKPAAAPPEVASGLDCLSGLVPRARSRHADPLRQLRAGPRRQIVARLPAHPRQRLVPAGLCDPPLGATASGVRIRHHGAGLPARHLGRRRADRTRRRHHHHRRSAETRGGLVAGPAAGRQRVV